LQGNEILASFSFLLIGMRTKRIFAFFDETVNALILLKIPALVFSKDLLVPAIMSWGVLIFFAALVSILSKSLQRDRSITGYLLLLVSLGNTSFLGATL